MHEPVWHGHPFPVGLFKSTCYVPASLLNDGTYRVDLLVVKDESTGIYAHDGILNFAVHEAMETRRGSWYGKWPGAVRPNLRWSTELVDPPGLPGKPG